MRKLRTDAKQIDLKLAIQMYFAEKKSLCEVAKYFDIHHTNLLARFKRYGIQCRTISEALKGNPKICIQKGEKAYNWKGGKSIDKAGYVLINRTKKREHRIIAEKVLGRKLKTYEIVHHINGNRADNRKCNLLISSKKYHSWLEAKLQNNLIGQNKEKRR